MRTINSFIVLVLVASSIIKVSAKSLVHTNEHLDKKQQSIIIISSLAAKGDLVQLQKALHDGLDAGLTVNQIKEVIVHLYAYCGFPRSIRGLQTFMEVLQQRKAKGITDKTGNNASPIANDSSKYERGKKILGELTNTKQPDSLSGYSAFAPVIDTFLKEHLFADIFERDVLTYAQRELVTISVLSAIGNAEPMLKSHLSISLNVGLSPQQLHEFVNIISVTIGKKEGDTAGKVLNEVLKK
jgi:4-carboxymuconolactone decarboxylase